MRMETDGCGFLVEPMNSIFPSSAFRSPLSQSSGVAAASIVTFVSDIDWKGWYIHTVPLRRLRSGTHALTVSILFLIR